jgi:hypothetical protein
MDLCCIRCRRYRRVGTGSQAGARCTQTRIDPRLEPYERTAHALAYLAEQKLLRAVVDAAAH